METDEIYNWLLELARKGRLNLTAANIQSLLSSFSDDPESDFGIVFFEDIDDYIDVEGEDTFVTEHDLDEDGNYDEDIVHEFAEVEIEKSDSLFLLPDGAVIGFIQ